MTQALSVQCDFHRLLRAMETFERKLTHICFLEEPLLAHHVAQKSTECVIDTVKCGSDQVISLSEDILLTRLETLCLNARTSKPLFRMRYRQLRSVFVRRLSDL